MSAFRAACIQLCSGDDVAENIRITSGLIREAAGAGAAVIATPENTTVMAPDGGAKLAQSYDEAHDPALPVFSELAKELGIWLLVGSLAIKVSESKTANRSFLIDPKGRIAARYSKIHLFDVDLPGRAESYRESAHVAPGSRAALVDTPAGRFGLSVCYDVRFPELYRHLSAAGAQLFAVPSAFTSPTGRAHWETLLRARAIENKAYVVAPAQGGSHAGGRRTYGHTMIVDPWGDILGVQEEGEGLVVAEIDPERIREIRRRLS